MKHATLLLLTLLLAGCSGAYREYYDQVAPNKFPPTERVEVFEYSNVNLKEIYDLLYSDYLIIGKAHFKGTYEEPGLNREFAKSIGADVFIATSQFTDRQISFVNTYMPVSSTAYVRNTLASGKPYYRAVTTYHTVLTTVPVTVNNYDQEGYYLKNVNNVTPLWEQTREHLRATTQHKLSGIWANENYEIELYQSGQQMVAVLNKPATDRSGWQPGQIKLIYGVETGTGVYLMGDKTPMPAEVSVNKFGHLQIKVISSGDILSFARQ